MSNRLQVGIDFSHRRADLGLFTPDGQPIESHIACANSISGYCSAKRLLLQALEAYHFDGLDVSGEATSYYWLPFFLQLAADPDLAHYDPQLFLLNPRWVHWFKKCFAQDSKTDERDPYYIAERTRTRHPPATWKPQLDVLPLRFYTRLRFHLVQDLAREKCFFSAYLFLKASAYRQLRPFSDVFGATSMLVLSRYPSLDQLAALPVDDLTSLLDELSQHRLPDPKANATTLKRVAEESFAVPGSLALPLQRVLALTLDHIHFLQGRIAQVEQWIAEEAQNHPGVASLASIPGIGPVFSSGIAAEIGDLHRFLTPPKWDKRRKRYRSRTLRDAEDAIAKIAGLWWPRNDSGDFEAEDRHLAKTGNRYLRYYVVESTDRMRQHVAEYQAYYNRKYQEALTHKHKRALVLSARKSIGLFVGLLHRGEAYRPKET